MRTTKDLLLQRSIFLLVIISSVVAATVFAVTPGGPSSITNLSPETRSSASAESVIAQAGNVTAVILYGKSVTQTWQGYFGNITGAIVLEDNSNNPLYNWSLTDPEGYIFVTRKASTPDWTALTCWNQSRADTDTYYTLAEVRTNYSLASTDVDDVAATFRKNVHPALYFAGNTIAASSCDSVINTFNGSGVNESNKYVEVMLYDDAVSGGGGSEDSDGDLVFTTVIEDGTVTGFNGADNDFQFIVPEDGHNSNTAATTYQVYVYLE